MKEITPDADSTWSYRRHLKFSTDILDAEAPLIELIDEIKN
jgi:hypothetical protein